MGRVDGKVVLVSGGARGQGAEAARLLHREGAAVVVADRLESEGDALAGELGERCRFGRLDVSSETDWESILSFTEQTFGPISALVHSAGEFSPTPLISTTADDYMRAVEVNQLGSFLALRAGGRSMTNGGSIVLFSSTAAHMPSGLHLVAYAATKWAVRGMAHSAAIELASAGIRVNTVAPGAIRTPMITTTLTDDALTDLRNRVPLGRLGEPEDIAPLVLYLVSDESAYCTGSDFVIDGGMTAGAYCGPGPEAGSDAQVIVAKS